MAATAPDTTPDMGTRLQALREAGAPTLTPVRWHHLVRLQQRMAELPPEVSGSLEATLERALAACEVAVAQATTAAPATRGTPPARHTALTELNRHLHQQRDRRSRDAVLSGEAIDPGELDGLRRFRTSWSRHAAERQVAQAMGRTPDNAGPLNSHALVLRSLALMRERAPDYLQRFLAQLDTLMWLEDLGQRPAAGKTARRGRAGR